MPPKTGKEVGDPFAGLDGSSSAAEDAASLHGTQLGGLQSIRVIKVSIHDIQPDPLQPRRIIPNDLREAYQGDAESFLRGWINAAQIDPMPYFGENFDIPSYEDPIQSSLQQVLLLARSIKDTGLTNPITIIRTGRSSYTLETGERRWFAFQMLYNLFGDEFREIPARVMNERSVWRQASENNQRDDLNAIAKARQYALLMMDVLQSKGEKIETPENFGSERAYYAQVESIRMPEGFGDKIQNAMGFSSRMSVMRHRKLLGLSDRIWKLADDYNCPESVLRQILETPVHEQAEVFEQWLQARGKEQLVTNGYNLEDEQDVTNGNKLDEQDVSNAYKLDENLAIGNNSPKNEVVENFKKYHKEVSALFEIDAQTLTKKKRLEYQQKIAQMRRILDNLEARLKE
jgi:hypothetical protein